jgi:hypothetical protein
VVAIVRPAEWASEIETDDDCRNKINWKKQVGCKRFMLPRGDGVSQPVAEGLCLRSKDPAPMRRPSIIDRLASIILLVRQIVGVIYG